MLKVTELVYGRPGPGSKSRFFVFFFNNFIAITFTYHTYTIHPLKVCNSAAFSGSA